MNISCYETSDNQVTLKGGDGLIIKRIRQNKNKSRAFEKIDPHSKSTFRILLLKFEVSVAMLHTVCILNKLIIT